jgi:hypothetical protein
VVDHDEDWALGSPPLGPTFVTGPGARPGPPQPPVAEPSLLPPPVDLEPQDPRTVVREILARTDPAQRSGPVPLKQAAFPSEE